MAKNIHEQARRMKEFLEALKKAGFKYEQLSSVHFRVNYINFWPTTGKWWCPEERLKGHGVDDLIAELKKRGMEALHHPADPKDIPKNWDPKEVVKPGKTIQSPIKTIQVTKKIDWVKLFTQWVLIALCAWLAFFVYESAFENAEKRAMVELTNSYEVLRVCERAGGELRWEMGHNGRDEGLLVCDFESVE